MFIKTFKKAVSLLVVAMFVLSLMPVGALADIDVGASLTTIEKALTDVNYTRYNNAANKANLYNAKTYWYSSINSQYHSYVHIDLSGYEEILQNPGTTISMSFTPRYSSTDTTSKPGINDLTGILAPDNCDDIVLSEMTWNDADAAGFHRTSRPALFVKSDGINNGSARTIVDADINNLNTVLKESYDDSIVSVWFKYLKGSSQIYWNSSHLDISYDPSEIDNQEYMDSVLAGIETWKDLTGEESVKVSGLPKLYYGLNVDWESSDTNYITNDGKVYQHPQPKDVTLTATFSYKGADKNAQTVTTTKEFVVTVEAETPVEVIVPFTDYAYSRSSATNTADAKNVAYGYLSTSGVTAQSITTGGSFDGYTKLNLKGYEEILKNPHTSVQMSLTAGYQYSGSRIYNLAGVLAPDKADSYGQDTITWNIANKLGLHDKENRPVLFTKADDVRKASGSVTVIDADKDALLSVLGESDTNSMVSIHFAQLEWNGPLETDANGKVTETSDSTIRCNSATTGLIIKYYESEIDNDAFFADIEDSFAWDAITPDSQEAVVNNLPTYYKGADIVWSSGEASITSSGELIPAEGALINDTLTATVSYKDYSFTKEFVVTICDGKIALGTPALTVEGGKATASFGAVNGTGNDVVYKLYLATYIGDELIELVPFDFAVGKGKSADKTMDVSCPDGYKAKLFVLKSDGITPVLAATVK